MRCIVYAIAVSLTALTSESYVSPSFLPPWDSRKNEIVLKSTNDDGRICGTLPINHITFVSSNLMKIREVKLILGESFPWELRCESVDLDEPQVFHFHDKPVFILMSL